MNRAFRELLEGLSPACITDAAGNLLFANAAYKRLLPALMAAEQTLSSGDRSLLPLVSEALAATEHLGPGWSPPVERDVELTLGSERQRYLCRHCVLRDEQGHAQAIIGRFIAHNDDEAVRRQLAATQERLRDIARLVSDWIWETDRELRLVFVSERVIEATGRHPRSLVGRPIGDIFDGAVIGLLDAESGAPKPFRDVEVRAQHADGCERLFRISGLPVFAQDSGAFLGYRGTAQDITEMKAREAALRQSKEVAEGANRAKSEFLANVSHELRTPLNAVIGFSEIMASESFGPVGNDTYRGYAADILHSAEHLLQLINDILDVSKIEAGKMALEEEAVDPQAVATSALRLIADRARQCGLSLVSDVPDSLPTLVADSRAIKQVLLNLLSNAVKFTPAPGEVRLAAALADDGDFLFTVSDTGIGMTAEEIKIALTPFGQVDSRLARKFPGTGLGLPLSCGLVELHGGRLAVESEPKHGTTVTVRLPASRVAPS